MGDTPHRSSSLDYLTPDYIADPWRYFFHDVISGTATREELLDHAGMVRRCVDFFNPDVPYNDHIHPTVLIEAMHIATGYLRSALRISGLEVSRSLFLRGEHTVTEEGIRYITIMKSGLSKTLRAKARSVFLSMLGNRLLALDSSTKVCAFAISDISRFESTDLSERQRLKADLEASVNIAHLMLLQQPATS